MTKKTIKIRFIETEGGTNFSAQRKTWFGWRDIEYSRTSECGLCFYLYYHSTKEKLVDEILEKYYHTDRKFVTIIEYPSLKIYQ